MATSAEDWKGVSTALTADVLDKLGHRNQSMGLLVRPMVTLDLTTPSSCTMAGRAVTIDCVAHDGTSTPDPYGQLFAGSASMTPQSMHQSPFYGLNSISGNRLHSGGAQGPKGGRVY